MDASKSSGAPPSLRTGSPATFPNQNGPAPKGGPGQVATPPRAEATWEPKSKDKGRSSEEDNPALKMIDALSRSNAIDAAMISSMLTSVLGKLDASNIKFAAQKLTNVDNRMDKVIAEKSKKIDEQVAAQEEAEAKRKALGILADIALAFSTLFAVVSIIALGVASGGVGFAIAGAAISGVMSAMDVANRIVKEIPTATYTDAFGRQQRVEVSIGGLVDRIVDSQVANGEFDRALSGMTPDEKDKYLSNYKLAYTIAITIAISAVGLASGVGAAKAGVNAIENASGAAARVVAAKTALIQTSLQTAETVGDLTNAALDGANAGLQIDMAIDVRRGRLAENKAKEYSFEAEIYTKEIQQNSASLQKLTDSIRNMKESLLDVTELVAAMEQRLVQA